MRLCVAVPVVALVVAAAGCADPCLDDGLVQEDRENCAAIPGTETDATSGSSSTSPSESSSESADTSSSEGADTSSSSDGSTTEVSTMPWCLDQDGDGFGDPMQCVDVPDGEQPPQDTVDNDDDCNDNDAQTFPGAAENEGDTACMQDDDQDGWGDTMPPPGVDAGLDCVDDDASIFPGAAENDSDTLCMQDADGDGWGNDTPPPGVDAGTDCADDQANAFPGAAPMDDETACMLDDDGDDFGDASPPPSVTPGSDCADDDAMIPAVNGCVLWCDDVDLDGFGDPGACVLDDAPPPGYVGNADDCADDNPAAFPGAAQNDAPAGACMEDVDDDGFGDAMPPPGVTAGNDCDDADAAVSTGCAPCPAGMLFCDGNDDLAQCNANGTHANVVDDCDSGCDEVGLACWPPLVVLASPAVCFDIALGESLTLDATVTGGDGNYTYSWSPEDTLDDSALEDPLATPTEATSYTIDVLDGEGNGASDSVLVNVAGVAWQLDTDCELEILPTVFGPSDEMPNHVFSQNGTVACNIANALPSAFVCPREFEDVRVTGSFTVQTANDNDAIGFVWGWQDAAHFYILSWKQATQPVPLWGNAMWPAGITIKRVQGDGGPIDSQDVLRNIDTASSEVLADPSLTTTQGWDDFEEYDVTIDFAAPNTTIIITRVSDSAQIMNLTVVDDAYSSGRFGTFDASQDQACNGPWTSECL